MKRFPNICSAGLLAGVILVANSGCDWSSGGSTNSFNTSQGAGLNINFSGYYRGEFSGGRAVQNTTSGNIVALNIAQVGNSLTVTDNQGSKYEGSVGSPGLVAEPSGGVYPAGAELVQSQINWSGHDNVSALDIDFVGTIHVVSVVDIKSQNSSSSSGETKTETIVNVGQNTTETINIQTLGVEGSPFYEVTTTTVVTDNQTGEEISRTSSTTKTTSTTFAISEANSQYRLEGTWIEVGGKTSPVQARSAGSAGIINTGDTTTTEDTTTTP